VPAGFAYPAGIGDALTGIFAPIVALMVAQNRPHALKWAVAWNLFGTLDLIVAPRNGAPFSGTRPWHLPACARAIVPRTTGWNPHPHFIAQKSDRYQTGRARDGMTQSR